LANPGLSGFNSNSCEQTTQVLMGNGIQHILNQAMSMEDAPGGRGKLSLWVG
jgi:hypothetical protein